MVLAGDAPLTALARLRPGQAVSAFDAFSREDLQDLGVKDAKATRALLGDAVGRLKSLAGKTGDNGLVEDAKVAAGAGRRRRSREAEQEQPAAAPAAAAKAH